VLASRPEDNESASKEGSWLAEDTRKEEYFSEVREIPFGLVAGGRMLSKMAAFAAYTVPKCLAQSQIFRPRDWRDENSINGFQSSMILATVPGPRRRSRNSPLVGNR
jgi:hypothetical protein